jgi:hypothetical protein
MDWYDVSIEVVMVVVLVVAFGMVAIQIYKQWFSKK